MAKFNPQNERAKKDFFRYQTEARHKSAATLDGIRKALSRFELFTGMKDFKTFNMEQAIAFKKHLAATCVEGSSEPLSKATMLTTINVLKDFFSWLSCQKGYKSRIHVPDIQYFNLTEKDMRIAKAQKVRDFPTLEQIRKVIFSMPVDTEINRRNRALVTLAILTGMRDGALASLRLKHVDMARKPPLVRQEADLVNTKFSKTITTYFFPLGDDLVSILEEWVKELREVKLFGNGDPVFPRTLVQHNKTLVVMAKTLDRHCWSNASPIREIFKGAFAMAGLPYFSPHTFRYTLVQHGERVCRTPEEFKAWSQNLGHEHVLTTFNSYGNLNPHRQGEVIARLADIPSEALTLSVDEVRRLIKEAAKSESD